jgi:hypothetical protein
MSGKMNWDRVRKETLVRRHGSAWIPSVVELDEWRRKKKQKNGKKKRKVASPRGLPAHRLMPGCLCDKPIGFTGQHKAKCPLRNCESDIQPVNSKIAPITSYEPGNPEAAVCQNGSKLLTLSDLAIRLNRVRLDRDLRNLLILWERWLAKDRVSPPLDKDLASQAIRALMTELDKYK